MVFDGKKISQHYLAKFNDRGQQEEWAWYHCQNYFTSSRYQQLTITDYHMLSMHLSLYLAESNMYHGPSFISQNGYKIHRDAVQLICQPRYHSLNRISCEALKQPKQLTLLFQLVDQLNDIYGKIRQETYQRQERLVPTSPVSQQLITKVLLGTLACVPTFNTQSQKVFREFDLSPQTFSKEGLTQVLDFYQRNQVAFKIIGESTKIAETQLPEFKQLDIMLQHYSENTP